MACTTPLCLVAIALLGGCSLVFPAESEAVLEDASSLSDSDVNIRCPTTSDTIANFDLSEPKGDQAHRGGIAT